MGGIRAWTLLVSAAVHIAVLLLLIDWQQQGTTAAGLGGLEVALGPAGGASSSPIAPDAPPVEELEPPATVETVDAVEALREPVPPEPLTPEPPTPEVAVPVETVETPQSITAELPPPSEVDTPPLITAAAVDPLETSALPPPETVAPPLVEPRPVEPEAVRAREPAAVTPPPRRPRSEPPPRPTPARTTPPAPPAAQPSSAPAAVAAAEPAGLGSVVSTRGTPGAAHGADVDSDPGGGSPGPTPDYLGKLRAWLERHKEYPRPSRTRREEGTVLLRFVMERSGRVLDYSIERSSGHPALDQAVREMLARAQPLPPMPPEMQQGRLELIVPVQFALR